eukprot:maker-scaffold_2-snap-gene-23.2-mRNA-1 protein AED:0.00 eAED:0.00 QI:106/1/1/1/1/1/2/78/555
MKQVKPSLSGIRIMPDGSTARDFTSAGPPGQGFSSLHESQNFGGGFGRSLSLGGQAKVFSTRLSLNFDQRSFNFQKHMSQKIKERQTTEKNSVVLEPKLKASFSFLNTVDENSGIEVAARVVKVAKFFPLAAEVQIRCLNCFRKLSTNPVEEDRSDKMLRMGAGQLAMNALKNHRKEAAVVESAAKLISILSYSIRADPEANARAMMRSGAVDLLVKAFNNKDAPEYVLISTLQAINALHNGEIDLAEVFVRRGFTAVLKGILGTVKLNVNILQEIAGAVINLAPALYRFQAQYPKQTLGFHSRNKVDNKYIRKHSLVLDFYELKFPNVYLKWLKEIEGSSDYRGLLLDTLLVCDAAFYREHVNHDTRALKFIDLKLIQLITKVLVEPRARYKSKKNDQEKKIFEKKQQESAEVLEAALTFLSNLCSRKVVHKTVYEIIDKQFENENDKLGAVLESILEDFQDEEDEDIHFYTFCLINEFVMAKRPNLFRRAKKGVFLYLAEGDVLRLIEESLDIFSGSEKLKAVRNDLRRAYKGELHSRSNSETNKYFPCAAAS